MINLLNERILITGAHGFLGSYLVNYLKEKGVAEAQLSLPRSKDTDLRNWEQCRKAVASHSVVIHLAGVVVSKKEQQQRAAQVFNDNVLMNIHILEACRLAEVKKIVTIGSMTAYPAQCKLPFQEEELWNGYPDPDNAPYAISKRLLLTGLQAYKKQYELNGIHLIFPNLYGPGDKFNYDIPPLLPSLITQISEAHRRSAPEIYGGANGRNVIDLLYGADAAAAIYKALLEYEDAQPLNIGSGSPVSIQTLAQKIADTLDYKGRIEWGVQDQIISRYLNTKRQEKLLGFVPVTSLEEGLGNTIYEYQQKN